MNENKEKYKKLYSDLKQTMKAINEMRKYSQYVDSELSKNFSIDNKKVYDSSIGKYENNMNEVSDKISSEIIPDVYNRL